MILRFPNVKSLKLCHLHYTTTLSKYLHTITHLKLYGVTFTNEHSFASYICQLPELTHLHLENLGLDLYPLESGDEDSNLPYKDYPNRPILEELLIQNCEERMVPMVSRLVSKTRRRSPHKLRLGVSSAMMKDTLTFSRGLFATNGQDITHFSIGMPDVKPLSLDDLKLPNCDKLQSVTFELNRSWFLRSRTPERNPNWIQTLLLQFPKSNQLQKITLNCFCGVACASQGRLITLISAIMSSLGLDDIIGTDTKFEGVNEVMILADPVGRESDFDLDMAKEVFPHITARGILRVALRGRS